MHPPTLGSCENPGYLSASALNLCFSHLVSYILNAPFLDADTFDFHPRVATLPG